MAIIFNPFNIDLATCRFFTKKFDSDQSSEDLGTDIKMYLWAEEIILEAKGETVVAYTVGHMDDDFVYNKITIYFYHVPKKSLAVH